MNGFDQAHYVLGLISDLAVFNPQPCKKGGFYNS